MIDLNRKNIVIICGADHSGKSSLVNYMKERVGGKCHIMHSNYNKKHPGECNYNQHKLIGKFAVNNFKKKYYTGNRLVVLDRNYISDICYGTIGYGSKGDQTTKLNRLRKLFKLYTKSGVTVSLIYCQPSKDQFTKERDELLEVSEHNKIKNIYDYYFYNFFADMCKEYGISYYTYDYITDPKYTKILPEK